MYLRKLILLILIIYSSSLYGQDAKNTKIGLTISALGNNDVIQFEPLDGAPGVYGIRYHTFGFQISQNLTHSLDFVSGFDFSHHLLRVQPNISPFTDGNSYLTTVNLISIPFNIRYTMAKYFFIYAGPNLNLDISKKSALDLQTGIGGNIGIGCQIKLLKVFSLQMAPYIKSYALLPFFADNYPQRLFESGVQLGINYITKN